MTANRSTNSMATLLGPVTTGRPGAVERLMLILPSLAEGTLVSARVGIHAKLRYVAAELLLETTPRVHRVRQRLAFWFARAGGWAAPIESMRPSNAERFRSALDHCEISVCDLAAEHWTDAVGRMLATAGCAAADVLAACPELALTVGGPGWEAFRFDPERRELFVPSPVAPATGDELHLALTGPDPSVPPCSAAGTVVCVRRRADAAPGALAGFTVALVGEADRASALLEAGCPRAPEENTRAAPRYGVVCAARISSAGTEAAEAAAGEGFLDEWVRNLSHRGAFIETSRRRNIGERVDVDLRLPGRRLVRLPATVVHCTERGVGLQFASSADADATFASAIAALPGRPRRVLVVDDDSFARRIVVDGLEARGFEAITAAGGEEALRRIADELLTLDGVVTDLRMPGLSGDALVSAVRNAGGEQDLAVVVMSATIDGTLVADLLAAGADRVLPKDAGPLALVDAVEAVMDDRERARLGLRRDVPAIAAQR